MGTEWIAPTIAGGLGAASLLLGGFITYRNNRRGAVEGRAPTAAQAWAEADRARRREHALEDLFWTVLAALKHLVRSVKQEHPSFAFTDDVVEAVALKPPADEE